MLLFIKIIDHMRGCPCHNSLKKKNWKPRVSLSEIGLHVCQHLFCRSVNRKHSWNALMSKCKWSSSISKEREQNKIHLCESIQNILTLTNFHDQGKFNALKTWVFSALIGSTFSQFFHNLTNCILFVSMNQGKNEPPKMRHQTENLLAGR